MSLDLVRERTAESQADLLLSELQLSDPSDIDVDAIAMARGALVIDGGLTGAEARLTRSPKISFIRLNLILGERVRRASAPVRPPSMTSAPRAMAIASTSMSLGSDNCSSESSRSA